MESKKKFSWRARGRAFHYAFAGIAAMFRTEHNAWIHAVVALLVIAAAIVLRLSGIEWCLISLCIGGVFMAEAFNTAIEALCDKLSTEYSPFIKKAKDVAAGAVLLFVFAAVAVGLIIFIPKIF